MKPGTLDRALYWVFTALLAVLMVGSAVWALADYASAQASFVRLGFPAYLVLPLEIAKVLGIAAIVTDVSRFLKNLAYAGCFYQLLLALSAHMAAGDGPAMMLGAASGMVFVAGSFYFDGRRFA